MIPTPRPGPRHGDCTDCGRRHEGECHLAPHRWEPATALPPIRWRNATAEEFASHHGMPLWVAERMVAEQLAGSLRAMGEAIQQLPTPTHIVGPMFDVSDESRAIATQALREAWEKRGQP